MDYRHAYNVIRSAGLSSVRSKTSFSEGTVSAKPALTESLLVSGGFQKVACWGLTSTSGIALSKKPPSHQGVYAFCIGGIAQYVGVATMGLAKRLYFYAKPGISQTTSIRINGIINEQLTSSIDVDVLVASPEDMEWNGLPVHGCAGLELGLIKKFDLPWNHRSSN